jgi:hypothetical protein
MQLISTVVATVRRLFHRGTGDGLLEPGQRLKICAYKPEDFLNMKLSEAHRKARESLQVEELAQHYARSGPAFTVFDHDGVEVLMCIGLERIYSHYSCLWMELSPLVVGCPGECWCAFMALMRAFSRDSYLQVLTPPEYSAFARALERLGFVSHGILLRANGEKVALSVLIGEVA